MIFSREVFILRQMELVVKQSRQGKPPFPTCEIADFECCYSPNANLQVGKCGLPQLASRQHQHLSLHTLLSCRCCGLPLRIEERGLHNSCGHTMTNRFYRDLKLNLCSRFTALALH